ncbi:hypothetical protein [Nitrospira sp. Nam74]
MKARFERRDLMNYSLAAPNAGITSPDVQEYYRHIFYTKYAVQRDTDNTGNGSISQSFSPEED